MNSDDSIRTSEDAAQSVAGVECKMHHHLDANVTNDKSPATTATSYESSFRVKPNAGGSC
jgi:hypothetical protein